MAKVASDKRRDELHARFADLGLVGYWQRQREQHNVEPRLWRWDDVVMPGEAAPAHRHTNTALRFVLLEYKNPVTGAHTFLTMTCHIQMLLPGQTTRAHRHTGTTHYHAVQGQGVTVVDRDEPIELEWQINDAFTLPPWRWHHFRNASETEPAILFSVTDRPMLEMTGLDREERE